MSGLGAAWVPVFHPDRFDSRLLKARDRLGGNTVTPDIPQERGGSIPFETPVRLLVPMYRFIQGARRTWCCGAHTLFNSQEACLMGGLATRKTRCRLFF